MPGYTGDCKGAFNQLLIKVCLLFSFFFSFLCFLFLFFFLKFIYLFWERESACAQVGEGWRERDRERIPSRLHTVSAEPDRGLWLTKQEIMTWAEIKGQRLNWLSHPGAPMFSYWGKRGNAYGVITKHLCYKLGLVFPTPFPPHIFFSLALNPKGTKTNHIST